MKLKSNLYVLHLLTQSIGINAFVPVLVTPLRTILRNNRIDELEIFDTIVPSRRRIINQIISTASLPFLTNIQPAFADIEEESSSVNVKCLADLPPVKEGNVRVYLCRHGQTENNRLRLVQGARVDLPINETGRKQAIQLGKALSYTKENTSGVEFPKVIVHSSLQRARETATVASLLMNKTGESADESLSFITEVLSSDPINESKLYRPAQKLEYLSSLGEVDFGSGSEGKSVNEARVEMMSTYSQWAIGKLDVGSKGEGETGESVLSRASSALNSLKDIASLNGGSVIAVTHSTYLRMLLSLVLDVSLLEGAMLTQNNCCINVIDLSTTEMCTVGSKSKVFGGIMSVAPDDFSLTFPKAEVVRQNEIRHLTGLL